MKEILVEEVVPRRPNALRSTVVRIGNRGYWVDTVPLDDRPANHICHDTKVFTFSGYEKVGHSARVNKLVDSQEAIDNLWNTPVDAFVDDPDGATSYHDVLVEIIAQHLEQN